MDTVEHVTNIIERKQQGNREAKKQRYTYGKAVHHAQHYTRPHLFRQQDDVRGNFLPMLRYHQ